MAFAVGVRGAWWRGCGLAWPALSATGLAAPSRAGKRGGMEGPAPRGHPALFLGSGSQSLRLLSPQGTSPQGFGGQYLSPDGENFSGLMTTCVGHCSVVRQSSDSTLGRADSVWMHSRFS